MNGIEKILERITKESDETCASLLEAADARAAEIRAEYEKTYEERKAELEHLLDLAVQNRKEQMKSIGNMETRKILLSARTEGVNEAFDKALQKLCSLPEESYVEYLVRSLHKAAPSGKGEVIFSEKDRENAGKKAVEAANAAYGASFTLSSETRDMCGGFILKNGAVEVNCDLEAVVRLRKQELTGKVSGILFS